MENYTKAGVVEQPCPCPFPNLHPGTPEVRVRDGSKIRNLMRFALNCMEGKKTTTTTTGEDEDGGLQEEPDPDRACLGQTSCHQILFTGSDKSTAKAITCVEILKRRVRGLHQVTRLSFRTIQEIWEPLEPGAGLDSLKVSRKVPAIWVLLSRDPLDPSLPGYQAPGSCHALWAQAEKEETGGQRHGARRKRGGGGGGGGRGRGPRRQTGHPREGGKILGPE